MGLLSRAGKAARDAVLKAGRDGNEWAVYTQGGKMTSYPWSGGNRMAVRLPYDAKLKDISIHHNHPTPKGTTHPLSLEDFNALLEMERTVPGWAKTIFAHEAGGGTSMAARAGRTRHRKAKDALEAGWKAADKHAPNKYGVGSIDTYATGLAAKRQRLFDYGYEPHAEADAILLANRERIRQATEAAYRAMHGPIHGLPYPITWGGIGAAGAGAAGTAAYGMSR